MDLKSFGEESFDPKQWINKAWRSNSNQEKEIFVANTVTRLQLYMKQLTNSLDETTTQIVTSIPRIMQDASSLQLEGALLQQKLLSLEQKVQSVEEQTGHSIESLQKIDSLKSRLESAASALREADKWAALATSLEDILDSGVPTQGDKLAELCDQVAAMTASLEVLSDAPDYETKRLQLETLYNRLEAAVSPPLIEALTQMDAERTSRYVTLFSGMCRGVSVCRCWRRAAAQRLALAWRRLDAHSVAALGRLLAGEAARQVSVASRALRGRARQAAGGRGGATGECRLVCRLTRTPWPRSAGCWRARRRDRLLAGEAARQVSVASCVASRALRGRARQAAGGRGGATGECRLVCRLTRTPWPRSAGCWRARRRDRLLAGEAARQVSVASCVASRALRGRARQAAGGRGGATGECRLVCRLTRTPWPRSAGCWRARRRDRLLAGEAARQVSVASCVASRALRGRARQAAGGRGGATGECRLVCRLTRTPWPRSAGCWRARRRDRLLAGEAARQVSVASCVASRALRGRARQAAGGRGGATDWLTNVLKSETPLAELVRLYTDLLLSLEPSPTKVVSANLKLCSNPDEGILLLTDLRTDIDDFVSCIQGVIDAPRQNKEILPPATLREFGRAVYGPLRELLPKYTEMQAQLLITNLQDPQLKQEDLLEQSRAILVVAERCEGWLSTAHSKAKKIAGDAMYAVYMPAVESFVSTLSNVISSHSRRIESTFLAAVTNGQATGVLCASFPASLLLESAVTTILDTLANGHKDEEIVNVDPLHDLPTLLLESEVRNRLSSFRDEPVASVAVLRRTKDQLRNLARAVLRNPVDLQLDKIPQLSVWSNNDALATDLPDFALSPQEYITEIGQYLMTLPQHLEMHLSEKQAPLQFLSDVCTHTCEVYAEKILNIRNMDALGTKRCLNDIVYLSSVVEDLGSAITPALRNLEKSLRAATPSQPAES
ncbi:unnamed protein product [Arctia plantaginis]|uniref:Conserved oligomeric Golgi complex subunit 7 n=1 Tax=Arctia plantaginis TaxID=874455 RepID=A0A8S0YU75_ARCPL|nr:unnamed protein product [Arctia plantaginis]